MLALCALAILPVALASSRPVAASGTDVGRDRVLVVAAPALRWVDLSRHDLPHLERFLADSTVAMLSMRTIGARTSIGEGYVTIGAGNRASVGASVAGLALEPHELIEEGTAAQTFERRTGKRPAGALLHLGFPAVERLNDRFLYGAEPGALGEALESAGRSVGVVANADLGAALPTVEPEPEGLNPDVPEGDDVPEEDDEVTEDPAGDEPVAGDEVVDSEDEEPPIGVALNDADYGRAAALAAMDRSGQVAAGEADGLLARDAASPYGVRYDRDAVLDAFDAMWVHVDVAMVELSDLDRTDSYRREADRAAADEMWDRALRASDDLFAGLLDRVDDETTVVVVSPAAPRAAESLGVFAISDAGGSVGGLARSGATRRAGYVTLSDIAPTILDRLDVDAPSSMTGTVISEARATDVDAELFAAFADSTRETLFRDDATGPVSVVFVVAQIVAYALAAVAVARRRRWTRPVGFLALVILATPPVAFLAGLLHVHRGDVSAYLAGIFAGAIVLAAGAEGLGILAGRRWPRTRALVAPLSLVSLTWLVLAVDIVTGGWLQINTVFGYSPIVAGRFAGFGNLAFALVAMGAVVIACGGWAAWRVAHAPADGSARVQGPAVAAIAGFLGLTVVLDGAPMWGSDVGGVLASVPAFAVLVLVAVGARVDWWRALLIAAGTGVALAVFAAVDLARPQEDRTHLGRLVARVADTDGTGGGLGEVLERKMNSNVNILTSSVWTLTIPAALGLMVFLARRRTGFLRDLQEQVPGIRAMLAGGLLVAFLGFALNDSGVAVPAMMFAVLLPFITYVLLRWDPAPR